MWVMQAIEVLIERLAIEAGGGGSPRQESPAGHVAWAFGAAASAVSSSMRRRSAEHVVCTPPGHGTGSEASGAPRHLPLVVVDT